MVGRRFQDDENISKPLVFLSYKHADRWTEVTRALHMRLSNVSEALRFDVFMDESDLAGGDVWRPEIERRIARTTHFIVMLCNAYWESPECRAELAQAHERYESTRALRLLFVQAERMNPKYLLFEKNSGATLVGGDRRLTRVSDVHFLGPFDAQGRLERLEWNDPSKLDDQLAQLVDRLDVALRAGPPK